MSMFTPARLRRPRRAAATSLALATALALLLGACGGSAGPTPSFDPAAPCTTDVQQTGAYPALEQLVPATWDDIAAGEVSSGRTCTAAGLGSLFDHGVRELRFAGATWKYADGVGMTIAVFEGTGLDTRNLLEFYKKGAKEAGRTDSSSQSTIKVGTEDALRFDATDPDGKTLLVVTWPADEVGRVHVLLGVGLAPDRVTDIIGKLGTAPAP